LEHYSLGARIAAQAVLGLETIDNGVTTGQKESLDI
jgi:hypothetical protein